MRGGVQRNVQIAREFLSPRKPASAKSRRVAANFTSSPLPLKRLFTLLPSVLLLAGCAVTSSQFHTIDLDRNGVLSRGEFTDAVADASFRAYDRNGDGYITLGEWQSVEKGGTNDALFRARDMSRNGRISPQESRLAAEKNGALAAHFSAIDRNRDGVIDAAEARSGGRAMPR